MVATTGHARMHILSNAFPSNMPDAEQISQGGPANFAHLFIKHIVSRTTHRWTGVLFESVSAGATTCEKKHTFQQQEYYQLRVLRSALQSVVAAKKIVDPALLLKKPIQHIVELIKAQKPDIIFLNGFGIYNWILLKAGEITQTPVVIQHAGIWTKELSIHKKRYSTAGRKIMELMEQDSTRIASFEIFLNEWSKKYYHSAIANGAEQNSGVVPLPFDFASFKKLVAQKSATVFAFDSATVHIGIIARWDDIKNHGAVLALAKEAKRRKLPWEFHAVTSIPETDQYTRARAAYAKHVDIVPPLDREGIAQFCKAVDLLVLPSRFDVSPTVVLEAVASNTPIVISSTVGFADAFQKWGGKNWVVDFTDTAHAASCIKKLLGKPMPKQLLTTIKQNHKATTVFVAYLRIFNNVLAR